jgi:hypothetical protein
MGNGIGPDLGLWRCNVQFSLSRRGLVWAWAGFSGFFPAPHQFLIKSVRERHMDSVRVDKEARRRGDGMGLL